MGILIWIGFSFFNGGDVFGWCGVDHEGLGVRNDYCKVRL